MRLNARINVHFFIDLIAIRAIEHHGNSPFYIAA